MNIHDLSNSSLLGLHLANLNALTTDDAIPKDQEKTYNIRADRIWKKWCDDLEAEIQRREIEFKKIPW